jgi:hypothetical protein
VTVWLLPADGAPVWIPVVTFRNDGKACICYAPHDDMCTCDLVGSMRVAHQYCATSPKAPGNAQERRPSNSRRR